METKGIHYRSFQVRNYVPHLLSLIIAIVLKYHYTTASINELNWILLPTSKCVELFSGIPFAEEIQCGYVNFDHGINIARSCAGVNFFILAFSTVILSLVNRYKGKREMVLFLIAVIISAYAMTIIVNTLRILISIKSYEAAISLGWFTEARIHRIEGIFIYVIFLYLFYNGIRKITENRSPKRGSKEKDTREEPVKKMVYRWVVPLSAYLVFTICIPLVTSVYRTNLEHLWEHSLIVFPCAIIIVLVLSSIQFLLVHVQFRNRKQAIPLREKHK